VLIMPGPVGMVCDSSLRLCVAHWLWTGEPLTIGVKGPDGQVYANYGIGQSLVMLPADVAATVLLRHVPLNVPDPRFRVVSYLLFPVLHGLTLWAAYALLRSLGFTEKQRLAGVLALLFGSTFLWHCQNNQENNQQLLLVLVATICFLHYGVRRDPRWLLAGAIPLGFNILFRLPALADLAAVSCVPVLLAAFGKEGAPALKEYAKHYTRWAAPVVLVAIGIDRWYHYHRFGTLTGTYQHLWGEQIRAQFPTVPVSFPFSTPFAEGFFGPFVFPGKSVFLYDPLLLLGATCFILAWKRLTSPVKAVIVGTVCSLMLTAAGYARYVVWSGEPAWGNRFTTVPVHILVLLSVPCCLRFLPSWRVGVRRAIAAGLIVLAVTAQVFSLLIPAWVEPVQAGDATGYLQEGKDPPGPGQGRHFQLGMRVENVIGAATGRFSAWGLDHTADGKVIGPHPIMLVPFLPFESLSLRTAVLIKCAWFAVLGLLAVGLLACGRVLFSGASGPRGSVHSVLSVAH
jgi:hypothetical protein